jgi:hypothetical protein
VVVTMVVIEEYQRGVEVMIYRTRVLVRSAQAVIRVQAALVRIESASFIQASSKPSNMNFE